jgi:hypothetical protein
MAARSSIIGRKQEDAIVALLTQRNVEEAARAAGIGVRTLLRWLKLPEFQAAYRQARRAAFGQALARLQQATSAAATTLLKTMIDPGTPASVKVRAAEAIFNHASKGIELEDTEARVSELEQAAELTKAGGKTVTRGIARLEDQFGTADGKPLLLLVVSNAGWGPARDRDACIQIPGECGFMPAGSLGPVNLSEIPDGLNAEETEKFLRENVAKIFGSRRAQNDDAGA